MAAGLLSGAVGGVYRPASGLNVSRAGLWVPSSAAWVSSGGVWAPLNLGEVPSKYVVTLTLVGTPQSGTLQGTVTERATGLPTPNWRVDMFREAPHDDDPWEGPVGGVWTNTSGAFTWTPGIDGPPPAPLHPSGFRAGVYQAQASDPGGITPSLSPRVIVNGEMEVSTTSTWYGYTWLMTYLGSASTPDQVTPANEFAPPWCSTQTVTVLGDTKVSLRMIAMPLNIGARPGWSVPTGLTHWKPSAAGVGWEGTAPNLFSYKNPPTYGQDKYQNEVMIGAASASPVGVISPIPSPSVWRAGFGITCHDGGIGQWPVSGDAQSGMSGPPTFYADGLVGDPAVLTPA